MTAPHVDGAALIRALRSSRAKFVAMHKRLLEIGASDGDIVRAMANSREIINCNRLGLTPEKKPRRKAK